MEQQRVRIRDIAEDNGVGAYDDIVAYVDASKDLCPASNHNPIANHRRVSLPIVADGHLLIDPAIFSDGFGCNHGCKAMLNVQAAADFWCVAE